MKFSSTNDIQYMQDFGFYTGVPSGIEFEVVPLDGGMGVRLVAPNHGGKPYGNGALFVYSNEWKRAQEHLSKTTVEKQEGKCIKCGDPVFVAPNGHIAKLCAICIFQALSSLGVFQQSPPLAQSDQATGSAADKQP